ncbi:MAG: hypothetical protein JSU77_08135 [Fidelibacterota bacterium]|nr:MAG: hypothetical protein JSU77_08135 [Candidatus Neomarinimicrobiota bacterium]
MKHHDFLSAVAGGVAASALGPAVIWAEDQGQWKLVSYNNESHQFKVGKGERTGNWEHYDLEADRTEMHNLAGKHPEKAAEL